MLAWVQTEGDITNKLDGRYVFAPTADGGTEVTYHLEVGDEGAAPGLHQDAGPEPHHVHRPP